MCSMYVCELQRWPLKNVPEPRKQRKPIYLCTRSIKLLLIYYVYFPPCFTCDTLCMCCLCSLLHLTMIYSSITLSIYCQTLGRIQAPSPRHRCGPLSSPPPLLLLDSWRPLSKLEFESRHSLLEINGDLCSHRDDLEYRRSFTNPVLPIDVGPTIPPPHDTITIHSCQLGSMNLLPSTPRRPKLVAISIYYYCSACVWTFLWSLLVLIVVTAYLVPYMSHTYIHTKYSSSGVISYRHPVHISQTIILIILLLSVHLPAERNHKKTRRGPQRAVHAAISFQNFSSCGAHGARKKTKKSPIDSTEAWRHPIASWHPTHRSMASHITHARGRSPVIFTATTSTINTINTSRLSRSVGVYIIYYENSSVDAVEVIYLAHSATNWLPQEYTGEKKKRYQVPGTY